MDKKTCGTVIRSLAFAAALALLAGCGSSGGGGGAAPVVPPVDSGGGNGGGTGASDTTNPVLAMIYPEPDSSFSESIFRAESFYIQFSYTDASAMNDSSLAVSFKMDDDAAQDVTSFFSAINSTNIRSAGIYTFTRNLYVMPTNTVNRLMKITVTIKDSAGNTGTATSQFTVLPVAPPRVSGN